MRTTIRNERRRPVVVLEADGTPIHTLEPGASHVLETDSNAALFAPYDSVVFVDQPGWVKLSPRADFSPPVRTHPTTFILIDGPLDNYEVPLYGQHSLILMRGVPAVADLHLLDPLVIYERVELGRKVMRRFPSDWIDGMVAYEWVEEPTKVPRPLADIQAIQREIEALAAKADLEHAAQGAVARE